MKQSHVCLDADWYGQLNFLKKTNIELQYYFQKWFNNALHDPDEECEGQPFMKVKYSDSSISTRNYLEVYDIEPKEMIDAKILLEI